MQNKTYKSLLKKIIRIIIVVLIFLLLYLITQYANMDTSEEMVRSTSLIRKNSWFDGYERIDYVDEKGSITYAADKHYATKIIRKDNNKVFEEFYGTDGRPARQNLGYYYISRLYDKEGREYKTIYLDIDKKPVMTRAGYATVVRTFNKEGNIEFENFFDGNNKPIETNQFGYGCKYEYDNTGKNIKTIYLNIEKEPCITGQGFAIIHKSYYVEGDNAGRVKEEYYYDENEEPIRLKKGEYGLHIDYDQVGRPSTYTYLGIDAKLTVTIEGYTTIKRAYYNDDSVKCDFYYDQDGLPVALSGGQYGVLRKKGQSIWLDVKGNEIKSFRNLLFGSIWFSLIMCVLIISISTFLSNTFNKVLLVLYGMFIIFVTLLNRNESAGGINLIPFWSYRQVFQDKELTIGIIKNLLLFIPFAAVLYNIIQTKAKTIFSVFIASIIIEAIQYIWNIGLCEIDDVISNTIGGLTGYWLAKESKNIFHLCVIKRTYIRK